MCGPKMMPATMNSGMVGRPIRRAEPGDEAGGQEGAAEGDESVTQCHEVPLEGRIRAW